MLCLSLLSPCTFGWSELPVATGVHPAVRPEYQGKLQGDARIVHALNRLTFGPRPGDLDAIRAMGPSGLDRWFDQQLHPASLDQSNLKVRLSQYPAMQLSSEDLLFQLPSNAVIRQVIDGKASIPQNGVLHAVYANEAASVAAKKLKKEKNQQQAGGPNGMAGMMPGASNAAVPSSSPSMDATAPTAGNLAAQGNMTSVDATAAEPAVDPSLISTVLALPAQQRLARLAAMQQPEFDNVFRSFKGPQRAALTADMTPGMKEIVGALENPQRLVVDELMAQRLSRDIYSNAQLQEVMTDFWLNHFNVFLHKNEATPYYLVSYERDVIRPHALGKFEDLLEATAHSPAMMLYLDNASSTGPDSLSAQRVKVAAARQPANKKKNREGLNENYARELMELQTLGVNGGYTQADVTQVARILTGWSVDRPQRGGGFKFEDNRHEPGTKKVLGKKFKDHGEREGRDLLHFLVTRPATAHFISRKLAIRFVSDDPPQSLVDRMAKSYMSSGGDMTAVLKTMFHSPEFWSPAVYRAKVKTPIEYVVSAARASNANLTNMQPLANALREMGMPLYGAVPPTGYKWDAADWVSTGALVNRMNFALSLAANRLPGVTTTWSAPPDVNDKASSAITARMPYSVETTPDREEARLEAILIGGEISDSTRAAVLQQFRRQSAEIATPAKPLAINVNSQRRNAIAAPIEKQAQVLAGLLLGSPEFQRR
jgi:uncharacterized protein (DUF1800 family)